MIAKREYQERAVKDATARLKKHRRVLLVSPTGSGKTVIAVKLLLVLKPKRVLWVAHRIELLRQARAELIAAGVPKEDIGILSGTERSNEDARILIASVDMFRTRPVGPLNPDVVVIDEAHRGAAKSYQEIIYALPKAKVLGLTATPWRLDGTPLGDTFEEMVVAAGQSELILGGFIASPITYGIPHEKAKQLVKGLSKSDGDFSGKAAGQRMMRGKLMGDLVSERQRLAAGRPTIVFAASREYGKKLVERFHKAGVSVAYLDGESFAEDRKAATSGLANGKVEVVVNVDVLSEGFDCPPVTCIVLARPTKSLTRFLQQVGRGNRPHKSQRPIVLDHAGNCWRFGLPQSEREWSLDGRAKAPGKGPAPIRVCVECEALIPAGARICPECGAEQPVNEREQEEIDNELRRLQSEEEEAKYWRTTLEKLAKECGCNDDWVEEELRKLVA